jgi:hypothetical protein
MAVGVVLQLQIGRELVCGGFGQPARTLRPLLAPSHTPNWPASPSGRTLNRLNVTRDAINRKYVLLESEWPDRADVLRHNNPQASEQFA